VARFLRQPVYKCIGVTPTDANHRLIIMLVEVMPAGLGSAPVASPIVGLISRGADKCGEFPASHIINADRKGTTEPDFMLWSFGGLATRLSVR
jgi:hypothetical protein